MIILGKNSDDKGTQLEVLTQAILRKLGYSNIVCNLLGAGSEELDVLAEIQTSIPGASVTHKIICECKAYKSAVALPDWLKFLGKIYNAEASDNKQVFGCFVALSGVNGAVTGNYNELKKHRPHVTLLAGEQLLEETRKIHPFATLDEISGKIDRMTPRRTRAKDIAYYGERIYWLVAFDHDAYTILDNTGDCLTAEDMKPIQDMVDEALSWGSCINLQEEAQARHRTEVAMKIVLTSLMRVRGVTHRKSMDGSGTELDEEYSAADVDQAIENLISLGVLNYVPESDRLSIIDKNDDGTPKTMGEFFRFLLKNTIPVKALGCPWYDEHIDDRLLSEMCETQGGLKLTDDQAKRVLQIVRLSPNALFAALTPIEMIVNHRTSAVTLPQIDASDVDTLFHVLHGCLQRDFGSRALAEYFHETRKLVELEVNTSYKLKSYAQVELEDATKDRTVIGQLSPDMVGGHTVFVHMKALNDKPEPWEDHVTAPPTPAVVTASGEVPSPGS